VLTLLLVAVGIVLVGSFARVQDRSWVSPAGLFALIWAAYIPTLLFFVQNVDPFVKGMVWILVSTAAVWAGSAMAGSLCPPPVARTVEPSAAAVGFLRSIVRWPILIGLADVVWLFAQRGFSVSQVFSVSALMMVSAANRSEAYAGEADTPVLQRFAFMALFLGVLYGGMLFRLSTRRTDKLLGFLTLFLIIIINTLHGSRFGSIYGGAFWLSAYLATHVALSDPAKGVGSRFLLRFGVAAVVIVFAFSFMTMAVRYTLFSGESTGALVTLRYMLADPFGFVAAFGIWFGESGTRADGPLFGARVFRRLIGLWGVAPPDQYPAIDVGFSTSNIYTIFRELIEDFTLYGSLVALAIYGFLGRVAFWATTARRGAGALPWLTLAYVFAFTSVATSGFAYTTITGAAILFAATFRFIPPVTGAVRVTGLTPGTIFAPAPGSPPS
jgi:oligosaccharide repeat unit polymerase